MNSNKSTTADSTVPQSEAPNQDRTDAVDAGAPHPNAEENGLVNGVAAEVARLNQLNADALVHEQEGHRRTRSRIQENWRFIRRCIEDGGVLEAFIGEAMRRQVRLPGEGQNFYLLFAKALSGGFKPELPKVKFEGQTNLIPWEHNRSDEKLANVFRWLADNDVDPNTTADRIEAYAHRDYGNKINGIIAEDRAKHGKPRKPSPDIQQGLSKAGKLPAMARFPSEEVKGLTISEGFAVVVIRESGKAFELIADAGLSAAAIKRTVAAVAGDKGGSQAPGSTVVKLKEVALKRLHQKRKEGAAH